MLHASREMRYGKVPCMSEINVNCTSARDGWTCEVVIGSDWTESRHSVRVTTADLERLGATGETPEGLVRRSIAFVLERESKESILPSFALGTISRYFPEFDEEIRRAPA